LKILDGYKFNLRKNDIPIYSFVAAILIAQAYAIATGYYVFPILVCAAFVLVYLFYIDNTVLLFLILCARILLDSIPSVTYEKLAFGLSYMEYFTLGLMLFMIVYLLLVNKFQVDTVSKGMLLVLLAMVITTLYSGNIGGFIEVGGLWSYFIIAYIFFSYLVQNIPIKRVLLIIWVVSIYPLLNQFYSILLRGGHIHLGFSRYYGTYHHPNNVAYYLFFALPAVLYLLLNTERKWQRSVYIIILALLHFGIFMAGYRTIWMAVLVFWSLYILLISRRKVLTFVILASVIVISWNFTGQIITAKLIPLMKIIEDPVSAICVDKREHDALLSGRVGLWKYSLGEYLRSGFLDKIIGLGLESTKRIVFDYRRVSTYMHNEYFSFIVETGMVGFITFSMCLLIILRKIYQKAMFNKNVLMLTLSPFIAVLVIASADMPFRHIIAINYLGIYLAILHSKDAFENGA